MDGVKRAGAVYDAGCFRIVGNGLRSFRFYAEGLYESSSVFCGLSGVWFCV